MSKLNQDQDGPDKKQVNQDNAPRKWKSAYPKEMAEKKAKEAQQKAALQENQIGQPDTKGVVNEPAVAAQTTQQPSQQPIQPKFQSPGELQEKINKFLNDNQIINNDKSNLQVPEFVRYVALSAEKPNFAPKMIEAYNTMLTNSVNNKELGGKEKQFIDFLNKELTDHPSRAQISQINNTILDKFSLQQIRQTAKQNQPEIQPKGMLIEIDGPDDKVRGKKQLVQKTLESMGYKVNYNKGSRVMEIPDFASQQQKVQSEAKLDNGNLVIPVQGPDNTIREQKQLLEKVLKSVGYDVDYNKGYNAITIPDLARQQEKLQQVRQAERQKQPEIQPKGMLIEIDGPDDKVRGKKQLVQKTLESMGYKVNYNKGSRVMEIPDFASQQQKVQSEAKLDNGNLVIPVQGPDNTIREQKQLLEKVLKSVGYDVDYNKGYTAITIPDLAKQQEKLRSNASAIEVFSPEKSLKPAPPRQINQPVIEPLQPVAQQGQKTQPESRAATQPNTVDTPKKAKSSTAKTMGKASLIALGVAAIGGFPVGLALAALVLAAGVAKAGHDAYQKNKIKKENALRAPISLPAPVIEKKQELAHGHSRAQEIIRSRSPESQAFVKQRQESQQKNPVSKSIVPLPTPVNQQKMQQNKEADKGPKL